MQRLATLAVFISILGAFQSPGSELDETCNSILGEPRKAVELHPTKVLARGQEVEKKILVDISEGILRSEYLLGAHQPSMSESFLRAGQLLEIAGLSKNEVRDLVLARYREHVAVPKFQGIGLRKPNMSLLSFLEGLPTVRPGTSNIYDRLKPKLVQNYFYDNVAYDGMMSFNQVTPDWGIYSSRLEVMLPALLRYKMAEEIDGMLELNIALGRYRSLMRSVTALKLANPLTMAGVNQRIMGMAKIALADFFVGIGNRPRFAYEPLEFAITALGLIGGELRPEAALILQDLASFFFAPFGGLRQYVLSPVRSRSALTRDEFYRLGIKAARYSGTVSRYLFLPDGKIEIVTRITNPKVKALISTNANDVLSARSFSPTNETKIEIAQALIAVGRKSTIATTELPSAKTVTNNFMRDFKLSVDLKLRANGNPPSQTIFSGESNETLSSISPLDAAPAQRRELICELTTRLNYNRLIELAEVLKITDPENAIWALTAAIIVRESK